VAGIISLRRAFLFLLGFLIPVSPNQRRALLLPQTISFACAETFTLLLGPGFVAIVVGKVVFGAVLLFVPILPFTL